MTRFRLVLALLALTFLIPSASAAQLVDDQGLRARIDRAVMPYVEAGDFAGVIAAGLPGEEPLLASFGFASAELGTAHRADGIFMIGSASKQFTAAAILLLEEQGLLATDDTVDTWFPDLERAGEITIEQLITHQAGVADLYSLPLFGRTAGRSGTFAEVVEAVVASPLTHAPGENFAYSNGGYALLAAIIEAVSGEDYGAFLDRAIFDPLRMWATAHDAPGPARFRRVPGYLPWGVDEMTPAAPVSGEWTKGAGSLWSSGRDLVTWARALHEGDLLSQDSYDKFVNDGQEGYGYGVSVFERFGRRAIGHDGRVSGYASDLAHYPDEGITVAVLSNVESVARDEIRRAVAAEVFGEPPVEIPSRAFATVGSVDLDEFLGVYEFFPGFRVYVTAADGRLLARANEGGTSELVPLADGAWFSRMLYATVGFGRHESGRVDRLLWGEGQDAPAGRRVE